MALACFAWLIATYLLRPFWRSVARRQEVFLLAGFAYPLLIGAVFAAFGLSVELGALVAGISLSHSEYRFELITRMKPLKEIFLAPFFLAIGAGWAWRSLVDVWPFVLLGVGIVSVVGPLMSFVGLRKHGYPRVTALATALHLTHGGEFALLFLTVAAVPLHLSLSLRAALLSVIILSMLVGSVFMELVPRLLIRARKHWSEVAPLPAQSEKPVQVILFGCHRVGSDFLPVLKRQKSPFAVVDMDPQVIEHLQSRGIHAVFGDMANHELLERLHIGKARLIISTVPDLEAQMALLKQLRQHRARPIVILVAHQVQEALQLYKQGASYVILPHFLGGNYASQLIDAHGYADPEPFEVERLRHVEHLKKRGKSVVFLPFAATRRER